jgi:hydroxyethylthiazole kinase-like uncharacterized protein yjeF
MPVRVVNTEESAALDAAAVEGRIPSRALMRAAAFNAATVICARFPEQLRGGVTILTGPGNNGGDGWAIAAALASTGIDVHVREIVQSGTPDAMAERALWRGAVDAGPPCCGIIIDAMLGTGSTGELRGSIRDAAREMAVARARGAIVVALDLPSGVDAATGAHGTTVVADLTISFGSCKRGSLVSRSVCGGIVVVDIGLATTAGESLPVLVDAAFVNANIPAIAADAHKGTRKSVAIVAGAANMGGAAILAATAALRSGAGLVQVITDPTNFSAVHTEVPEALVAPLEKAASIVENWADSVLIGPGLGTEDATRGFIRDVIERWRGPIVVDAGAISAFDGDMNALSTSLRGRPAIMTPHPGELARLTGYDIQSILDNRFDIGAEVSRTIGAVVLMKGTPTVVSDPGGARLVVAAGTPALATGGSGDALGGMVATLLAQGCEPAVAAACAAWVHGRAAELTPGVRGFRLLDIVDRLAEAWAIDPPPPAYPVIASLAALG